MRRLRCSWVRHGFDSLAALCDEIFSLDKISNFSVENNASVYIFKVRNMKRIANEKEKIFLDLVELKIMENLRKQRKNKKDFC